MRRKLRIMLALLLIITIGIQSFRFIGIIKVDGKEKDTLEAGDWLYLNTAFSDGNWQDGSAKVYMHYQTKDDNPWQDVEMIRYDDDLLRVKIPDDMDENGRFLFRRFDPNNVNLDSWKGNGLWNIGKNNDKDIELSERPKNCNTCKLTYWDNSCSWAEEEVWNGKSYGGETIYFLNMDFYNTIGSIQAVFTEDGTNDTEIAMEPEYDEVSGLYAVTIPDDKEYDTVIFMDDSGNDLGMVELFTGDYNPETTNTYYYKRTVNEDGLEISGLDVLPVGSDSISGKKLYFDNLNFPVSNDEELSLEIGNDGSIITISADEEDEEVYSYTIPDEFSANQQTIITVRYKGNIYHFLWRDLNKDIVRIYKDVADISGIYQYDVSEGKRVIYFDAALSKLSYSKNNEESFALPLDGNVRYHAWNDSSIVDDGQMEQVLPREFNGNAYEDVYMAEVDERCNYIVFYSGNEEINYDSIPHTQEQEIPLASVYRNPCFYADTGDDYQYSNNAYERGGYWNEVYEIRNAEGTKTGINSVVDIPTGNFERQKLAHYVSATLYDYYTDYELNGFNRDNYTTTKNNVILINSHRIYQPFRQFNQALSEYYKKTKVVSPLYWGNFQNPNYGNGNFNEIADTLNLFGYSTDTTADLHKKFFYENNSQWGRNNIELDNAAQATVGLVSDSLTDDKLMLKTENNRTVMAPYFDEEFLQGKNSKNTVLAKVYHDVQFPFVQKTMSGLKTTGNEDATGTVDYWYFSSADTEAANKNLMLKQDIGSGQYYLESEAKSVKGATSGGSATNDGNYFPFNTSAESGDSGKLNYGFGQKMDFEIRLTQDGTVKTTNDEKVPIEFEFKGDDDVWIFIDGYLVLDVGGAHGIVEGTLDFAKRESLVSAIKNPDISGGIITGVTKEFPEELCDDDFYNKEHTLTMFYMERGLWESNLYISYNFPDESDFTVEKEVNTDSVNGLFTSVLKNFSFPFNIKNQATHYGEQSAGETSGFGVAQEDISEYGSANSGKLENAVGAQYLVSGSNEQKTVDGTGIFSLKDGESATFTDQFRRGSYIWLNEQVDEDNFRTQWELYDNGMKVTSTFVPSSNINVIGGKDLTDSNTLGTLVSDGRQEVYVEKINNKDVANNGYTQTGPAKIQSENGIVETNDTIVYRQYSEPDSIVGMNLKVKEINTVRTGNITVKKEQAADTVDLGEELFTFKVTFTDVSGMKMEGDTPIETSFELKKGEDVTLEGIPAGTKYTVYEVANDNYTLEEVNVLTGNDKEVAVNDYIVSGIITADDTDGSEPTEFTFVNSKNIGSIRINKRDSAGSLEGAEFTLYEADGVTVAADSFGNPLKAVTGSSGTILFSNIPVGTREEPKVYHLKETKTVTGYSLIKDPIEVKLPYEYHAGSMVNGNTAEEDGITYNLTYTIINDRIFELPSSGQHGIETYIVLGIMLIVTSGGMLVLKFRQKYIINKRKRELCYEDEHI